MSARLFSVVYADDEELVRTTVAAMLRIAGLQVTACASGAEAVRLCGSEHPDAVLLDLNMPEMDGFEVARRIREVVGRDTRIVALTGRSTFEYRKAAALAGFDEFLSKPVSSKTLIDALIPGFHDAGRAD